MREQVKLLEHHARFRANLLNIADIPCQRDVIHNNIARLVFLQAVDTANERRLPGAGRSDNDHNLLGSDT